MESFFSEFMRLEESKAITQRRSRKGIPKVMTEEHLRRMKRREWIDEGQTTKLGDLPGKGEK